MADELSKTVFKDPDCFINSNIWEIESERREEGPSWVWRDGKGGFEVYTLNRDHADVCQEAQGPGRHASR